MLGKTVSEIKVGESSEFSKTIGESDVYMFAGITGDLNPFHVNEKQEFAYFASKCVKGMIVHQPPRPHNILWGLGG